jgi:hypothetical protein
LPKREVPGGEAHEADVRQGRGEKVEGKRLYGWNLLGFPPTIAFLLNVAPGE